MAAKSKIKKANKKKTRSSRKGGLVFSWLEVKKILDSNRQLIWIVIFFFGISLTLISGFYLLYRQTILSFKAVPQNIAYSTRSALPSKILFLDREIDIVEAQIVDGIWQTSETGATHLENSARPGEVGNIIIYGHNKWSIFAPLRALNINDQIEVITSDGRIHEYSVEEIRVVNPDDIEVVMPTDTETLTVYTCTGIFDTKRLVIIAKPII